MLFIVILSVAGFQQNHAHFDDAIEKFLQSDQVNQSCHVSMINQAFTAFEQVHKKQNFYNWRVQGSAVETLLQDESDDALVYQAKILLLAQIYSCFLDYDIAHIMPQLKKLYCVTQRLLRAQDPSAQALLSIQESYMYRLGVYVWMLQTLQAMQKNDADISISYLVTALNPISELVGFKGYGILYQGSEKLASVLIDASVNDRFLTIYMKDYDTWSYVNDHAYAYAIGAAALLGVGVGLYVYSDVVKSCKDASCKTACQVWHDYVTDPLYDLKESLFGLPKQTLAPIDDKDLVEDGNLLNLLVGKKAVKPVVAWWNTILLPWLNDGIDKQRTKCALMNLLPAGLVSYAFYKQAKYVYTCQQHAAYVIPLRNTVRNIDMLLTEHMHNQQFLSYIALGYLYLYGMQLTEYVSCLSKPEQIMMLQDIQELLSLYRNIAQKQSIIDRMYRTYAVLHSFKAE